MVASTTTTFVEIVSHFFGCFGVDSAIILLRPTGELEFLCFACTIDPVVQAEQCKYAAAPIRKGVELRRTGKIGC